MLCLLLKFYNFIFYYEIPYLNYNLFINLHFIFQYPLVLSFKDFMGINKCFHYIP